MDGVNRVVEELQAVFNQGLVGDYEMFEELILGAYDSVCGDYGKDTFGSKVIPALMGRYGTNIRKMGIRGLKLISEAEDVSTKRIDDYLLSEISDMGSQIGLPTLEFIDGVVNSVLLHADDSFQSRYLENFGLVGVALFGSYFDGTYDADSDLDVVYFKRRDANGLYNSFDAMEEVDTHDPRVDFDFLGYFNKQLEKVLKIDIDMSNEHVLIYDKKGVTDVLYGKDSLVNGEYQVMSPYPWVQERIEKYANKHFEPKV